MQMIELKTKHCWCKNEIVQEKCKTGSNVFRHRRTVPRKDPEADFFAIR